LVPIKPLGICAACAPLKTNDASDPEPEELELPLDFLIENYDVIPFIPMNKD